MTRAELAEYFLRFWKNEAITAGSPLYAALCEIVAADEALLDLAAASQEGQPAPNMLFAAVHAVVVKFRGAPLAAYYASAGGTKRPDEELEAAFRSFCATHREEIAGLLRTRLTQTNEVRRCACLLPAFAMAWHEGGEKPLAIVEVGPSAGLNLNFDRYAYDYAPLFHTGEAGTVLVDTDVRGELAQAAVSIPPVASRLGIDLNPLDVGNAEDAAWLQALTWPEHHDRRELLAAAIEVARAHPPELIRGDAVELLPGILDALPDDVTPVVLATFVLNQFVPDARVAFRELLDAASRKRPLMLIVMGYSLHLGWEGLQPDGSTFVKLARVEDGVTHYRTVVHCHPHGRWLEAVDGEWVVTE